MNHLWAVTFNSEGAKAKILQAEAFNVKDHRCVVIDPTNRGVRLKLFWLLHGVQDDDVRVALAAFGKVTEITRDKWRVKGCVDKASTTRSVTLKLKVGVTIEDLPHQLRVGEDVALVHVPGRAPLCLRCRGKGHIRRECRVPRCGLCRRFGHDESQCVRSYANVTGQARSDEMAEHLMDEADAVEATHGSEGDDATKESTSKETAPAPRADTSQAGKDQTQPAVASKPAFHPEKADSVTAVSLVTTGQQDDIQEVADTEMPAASSVPVKRAHEDSDIGGGGKTLLIIEREEGSKEKGRVGGKRLGGSLFQDTSDPGYSLRLVQEAPLGPQPRPGEEDLPRLPIVGKHLRD
ncbi:uncharacterized protein [Dermacentor albipictus]|uniref:uncharacterized protein n=1 Tax=Dermacentor albipictus TaxID=60249 RepID=UPI0038FC2154